VEREIQSEPFRLMGIGEVSRVLGVSALTISKAYDRGEFKGYRTPGGWRKIWCWSVRKQMQESGVPSRFLENPPRKEDIMKMQDVCKELGISPTTAKKLIDNGHIEGWRTNTRKRERRTHREAVREFLKSRKNK
jgi:excisionase family DNA binding protein